MVIGDKGEIIDYGQLTINVDHYIQGLDYPANKEQILKFLTNKNASINMIDLAMALPEKKVYSGPLELSKDLRKLRLLRQDRRFIEKE